MIGTTITLAMKRASFFHTPMVPPIENLFINKLPASSFFPIFLIMFFDTYHVLSLAAIHFWSHRVSHCYLYQQQKADTIIVFLQLQTPSLFPLPYGLFNITTSIFVVTTFTSISIDSMPLCFFHLCFSNYLMLPHYLYLLPPFAIILISTYVVICTGLLLQPHFFPIQHVM